MKKKINIIKRNEQGFSLLEYVAGATVIAVIVFSALTVFGDSITFLFEELGNWVTDRADEIGSTGGIGE